MVAHDRLLRQALGDGGGDAAGVLADEFDLLTGDGVAMLLHIELDGVVHLHGGVGELAGIAQDERDLDSVDRAGRTNTEYRQRKAGQADKAIEHFLHCSLPIPIMLESYFGAYPRSGRPRVQCAFIVAERRWAGARRTGRLSG